MRKFESEARDVAHGSLSILCGVFPRDRVGDVDLLPSPGVTGVEDVECRRERPAEVDDSGAGALDGSSDVRRCGEVDARHHPWCRRDHRLAEPAGELCPVPRAEENAGRRSWLPVE